MGQHKRKKPGRQGLTPFHLALIGGVLLLSAAIFLAIRGEPETGTPAISVSQDVFDFGVVKFDTLLTVQVMVTNNGDGTLRFKEEPFLRVLEGC